MDGNELAMLFEPNVTGDFYEELSFRDLLVRGKRGKTQIVTVFVENPTNREIVLKKGVSIGIVNQPSAVIPLEIPAKTAKISGVTVEETKKNLKETDKQ